MTLLVFHDIFQQVPRNYFLQGKTIKYFTLGLKLCIFSFELKLIFFFLAKDRFQWFTILGMCQKAGLF